MFVQGFSQLGKVILEWCEKCQSLRIWASERPFGGLVRFCGQGVFGWS